MNKPLVTNVIRRNEIEFDKARGIRQAADSFRNIPSVVWEYVTNGLAYSDKGTTPEVMVYLEKDALTFTDNGRGMNEKDLNNFFKVHGENIDIKENNYLALTRGMYGTGSFSVFKFADTLKVTSVKDGKESCAILTSEDFENDRGWALTKDGEKSLAPNGTKFEVTNLKTDINNEVIKRCISHVQKQMVSSVFIGKTVYINNTPVEYKKPITDESYLKRIKLK